MKNDLIPLYPINRREFIQKSLIITGAFTLTPRISFSEDLSQPKFRTKGGTNFFRKNPRHIREVVPGFLWIDAADFDDYGGWWIDTQYTHLMGTSYLTANGVDGPVSPAKTRLKLSKPGRYRIHVRTRNWHKEISPGTFALAVNGKRLKPSFGSGSDEWHWESSEVLDFPAGKLALELVDLTGYFGRCSSILITRDLDFSPANDTEAFKQERARFSGLSLKPEELDNYDFVVVGGGCAGVCAALAAGCRGLKTLLVTDRPVLGGNLSIEVGIMAVGASSYHANARETGLLDEMYQHSFEGERKSSSAMLLENIQNEPNVTLLIHESVDEVEMNDDGTIKALLMTHTLEGTRKRVTAPLFLDSSGDAWLGYYAGAEYRFGREARDEFNEPWAPEKADNITMSGCLRDGRDLVFYRVADMGRPDPFIPPACTHVFPHKDTFTKHRHIVRARLKTGEWWMEHPGTWDDLFQPEQSRDELYRLTLGYWDWLKNYSQFQEELANYRLVGIPHYVGKRETRRLMGDYIMNAYDAIEAVRFEDTVGMSGWSLDVHHPLGLLSSDGPFDYNTKVPIHGFPYRILYSKNVGNLFMAGRNISCTHAALGTLRVQRTTSLMGEAVGIAAALCHQNGMSPREVGQEMIVDLQQELIRCDNHLPGFKNEDPEDLARQATVTASSTYDGDALNAVDIGKPVELTLPRAAQIIWRGGQTMECFLLRLKNTNDRPVPMQVKLESSVFRHDVGRTEPVKTIAVEVPANFDGWFEVPVDKQFWGNFYVVKTPKAPGVFWHLSTNAPSGFSRSYAHGKGWKRGDGLHAVFTRPSTQPTGDFSAPNVINGITRIVGITPNMWSSDPKAPLPQHVQLVFSSPQKINQIHLTFDTNLDAKFNIAFPPQCVRDYRVQVREGNAWKTVVTQKDNGRRKRIHNFPETRTDAMRVVVDAMNGQSPVHIFEVRLYNQDGTRTA